MRRRATIGGADMRSPLPSPATQVKLTRVASSTSFTSHLVRIKLQCNVWFYYVPSESNLSDWSSRDRLRDVIAMGARAVRMRIPRPRLSDLISPWSEKE